MMKHTLALFMVLALTGAKVVSFKHARHGNTTSADGRPHNNKTTADGTPHHKGSPSHHDEKEAHGRSGSKLDHSSKHDRDLNQDHSLMRGSSKQASKQGAAAGNSSEFGGGKGKGRDKPQHNVLPIGGIVAGVAALAVVGIGFRKYRARAAAANSNNAPLPTHAMTQPLPPAMTQPPKLALAAPISLEKHNSMV